MDLEECVQVGGATSGSYLFVCLFFSTITVVWKDGEKAASCLQIGA